MNRLSDNDKNWGPFTLGSWNNSISARLSSGDGDEDPGNHLLFTAFGRALRIMLPDMIRPFKHGYSTHEREYGLSLSKQGEVYDFLQVWFGPQTHDSLTTKNWCKFLPWTQWECVRSSIYNPDGSHFATEDRKARKFTEFMRIKDTCPAIHFGFEDYDGEMIVATCKIEEREWHRGEGWFKWLRWFYPAKIRRSLDLRFNAEVGPEKGSWKGGTTGHSIEMLPHEYPLNAFKRYCNKGYRSRRNGNTPLRFIGPCAAPSEKATA